MNRVKDIGLELIVSCLQLLILIKYLVMVKIVHLQSLTQLFY
jgi:hypothetical protein